MNSHEYLIVFRVAKLKISRKLIYKIIKKDCPNF